MTAAGAVAAGAMARTLVAAEPAAYQIGCYTRPFDQAEYRETLDAIAEAGYKYCGIMTAKGKPWVIVNVSSTDEQVAQVAQEIKKRGLKVLSLYGGEFSVAKSVEAGVAGLKRLIDHTATIGAGNLMLGGISDQKLYEAYFKAVAECCDYAVAKNIGMSIKPHGGRNATGG